MFDKISHFLIISLVFLFHSSAEARPEYAAKEKLSCIMCHANPWGGGPRTVLGKNYVARGLGTGPWANTDLVYGDLRFIAYVPEKPEDTANGLALMETAVTGNVPILTAESGEEFRGVLTYSIAPLQGSMVRETYVRW